MYINSNTGQPMNCPTCPVFLSSYPLSSCPPVLMSFCPSVLLSSCPSVLTSPCPPVLPSSFPPVLPSSCPSFFLSSCFLLLSFDAFILLSYYTIIILSSWPSVLMSSFFACPSVLVASYHPVLLSYCPPSGRKEDKGTGGWKGNRACLKEDMRTGGQENR